MFLEIGVYQDHVHFLIQPVPIYSPKKIVQTIKSLTAREILRRVPSVKSQLWVAAFWSSGYFINVKSRLADIAFDPDADEERGLLNRFLALSDREAAASKQMKDARLALDAKVAAKYPALSESEIKSLVVDDKWLARLAGDVQGELDRVSSALTGRIQQLAERYASPLPVLACEVEALAARVEERLKKMGAAWN